MVKTLALSPILGKEDEAYEQKNCHFGIKTSVGLVLTRLLSHNCELTTKAIVVSS